MEKRIVSFVTCICFLLYTGCYSMKQVTMDEFMSTHHPADAQFTTSDSLTYLASSKGYRVVDDSLVIQGLQVLPNDTKRPFTGSIPLDSVSSVGVKQLSITNTSLLLSGIFVVVGLFVIADALKDSFKFDGGIGKF